MIYARIYARGKWGKGHVTEKGKKTLCGFDLTKTQAVVELSTKPQNDVCGKCLTVFYANLR